MVSHYNTAIYEHPTIVLPSLVFGLGYDKVIWRTKWHRKVQIYGPVSHYNTAIYEHLTIVLPSLVFGLGYDKVIWRTKWHRKVQIYGPVIR